MNSQIEPRLYIDPQTECRTCLCEVCGGTCYWPEYRCIRCERNRL